MPLYSFRKEDGEVYDELVSLADYDQYLIDNKVERVWNKGPSLSSGYAQKPSEGFRDLLKTIHKGAGMNSKINTF